MWYVSDVHCDERASNTQEYKNSGIWIPHKKAKGLVGLLVLKVFVRQSSHPEGLVTFVPLLPSVPLLLTDFFNLCAVDQGVEWWVLKDNELEPWLRSRCNRKSKMSACACSSSSSLLITACGLPWAPVSIRKINHIKYCEIVLIFPMWKKILQDVLWFVKLPSSSDFSMYLFF